MRRHTELQTWCACAGACHTLQIQNWPAVEQKYESMTDDTDAATDFISDESPHFSAEQLPQEFAAWEEVDKGRFMPRRVRGSNPGRALG